MGEIFFISDLHLGHKNILTFKREDFTPLRPFASMEQMEDYMVDRWNSVVSPKDKVYVLGDVAFSKYPLEQFFSRVNGHKRLVLGNHDTRPVEDYLKVFDKVHGVRVLEQGVVLTHVPLHPDCLKRKSWSINVHGHLHAHRINSHHYVNVSVESVNYTPLALSTILTLKDVMYLHENLC